MLVKKSHRINGQSKNDAQYRLLHHTQHYMACPLSVSLVSERKTWSLLVNVSVFAGTYACGLCPALEKNYFAPETLLAAMWFQDGVR